MAREIGRLSPSGVEKETKPGMHPDGGGLYLLVSESGSKSWIYRFMLNGKAREMGLGPLRLIGLKEARRRAIEAGRLRLDGIDPVETRKAARIAAKLEAARAITFKQCAEAYIKAHRAGWRNDKHAAQWSATLEAYAYPTIGGLAVAAVDTGLVTKILQPIWTTKPETASRVRGRIESVLDYATTHGWRTGENPARWKGHLDNVLPARGKVAKVQHHAALPWREIGAFMAELAGQSGVSALALRFAILTAARTGEVIGARWSEIDLKEATWTVPEDRMKAGREHRVPLAEAALAVLREAARLRESGAPDGFIFPGGKAGHGLSNMALLTLLRRMGRGDITAHGFRSCFRDWCGETGQPSDLAEVALAHVVGDKTVAAYARGDLLQRRRALMTAWSAWCARPAPAGDNVVQLSAIGAVAHA
jgi:integrase